METLEQRYARQNLLDGRAAQARRQFAVRVAALVDSRGLANAGGVTKQELRGLAEEAARKNGLAFDDVWRVWRPFE